MEDSLLQNEGKSSGTNRCLLALLSLVAIAGVSIGVSSVVHSSSLQGDIDDLRSQLKALESSVQYNITSNNQQLKALESNITSINQFLGDDSVVTSLQCLDDTTKLAYASNGMAVASCPATCDATVSTSHLWGTSIYSASSSICLAAVHDGELQLSAGGIFQVVQQPGQDHYIGSTHHGVTSSDKDASTSSFSIGTTLRQNVTNLIEPQPTCGGAGYDLSKLKGKMIQAVDESNWTYDLTLCEVNKISKECEQAGASFCRYGNDGGFRGVLGKLVPAPTWSQIDNGVRIYFNSNYTTVNIRCGVQNNGTMTYEFGDYGYVFNITDYSACGGPSL